MKLMFVGAAHEVTGSCTYIEVGDKKGVVDYGMEQGKNLFENAEQAGSTRELSLNRQQPLMENLQKTSYRS